jgi:hypothetical protein
MPAQPLLDDTFLAAQCRHALRDRILTLDQTIATREAELNAIIYRLYRLTPAEIAMVECG